MRVGRALGFEIGPIRKVTPEKWLAASDSEQAALEEIEAVILTEVEQMTDAGRPSTAQDVQKGRRTEIDFIYGYVAEKGAEAGIPTPAQRAIVRLVREIELGRLTPAESNLDALVACQPYY